MKLIQKLENFRNRFSSKIFYNENLSKFSWFNIGGPASVLFKPKDLKELKAFLKEINLEKKIKILGAGSNTLFRDGGFDGIVIKFGKSFSNLSLLNSDTIIAGAAAKDKSVSTFAFQNSVSGFEFLSCIPGTVGGGIRMNSGCYGDDFSKILVSIQAIDFEGNIKTILCSDINFYYRGCNLKDNLIFLSATLKGNKDNKINIKKRMNDFIKVKKTTQPSKIKTCGSTFKNPKNQKAWKLIQDSGCGGMEIGDAQISKKHSNFFINKGKANSEDLENLIDEVKKNVLKKTGIKLELELQIVGKKL